MSLEVVLGTGNVCGLANESGESQLVECSIIILEHFDDNEGGECGSDGGVPPPFDETRVSVVVFFDRGDDLVLFFRENVGVTLPFFED